MSIVALLTLLIRRRKRIRMRCFRWWRRRSWFLWRTRRTRNSGCGWFGSGWSCLDHRLFLSGWFLRWRSGFGNLCQLFGRSRAHMSAIFIDTTTFLDRRFRRLLSWHLRLDQEEVLEGFARDIGRVTRMCGGMV